MRAFVQKRENERDGESSKVERASPHYYERDHRTEILSLFCACELTAARALLGGAKAAEKGKEYKDTLG